MTTSLRQAGAVALRCATAAIKVMCWEMEVL
jgi:hypothetical protein